ncbi:MAG: 4-hydroxy-tetrahydrodipicolinate reductase [Candidatus Epulonipiscioides saccharophilum]|nr:MAG: 4-hydroxy-tetrahydrodipicolinate reductase [Epulopiscium sp. AS2M-Bin001]
MTKILMHGCNGRLGQVISKLAKEDPDIEIILGIDVNENIQNEYQVLASLDEFNSADYSTVDVIIDFSTASAVPSLLNFVAKSKIPTVLCTTGLDKEQIEMMKQTSKNVPIFYSANMSLGINLLINLANKATKVLKNSGFDIEILEKHHNKKIDAPSGTAISIAENIQKALDSKYKLVSDRTIERKPRDKEEIGIHSIRGGTIVGEHDVIFAGNEEIITISHKAMSREVFATGAIKAAKYLIGKNPGLYDMNDLLED